VFDILIGGKTMNPKSYLVTGGTGFIGSALVRRLVAEGHHVRVLDNQSRGLASRLDDILTDIEFISGDIRDPQTVSGAVNGVDSVCHLAFVNGTEFFYSQPELVLDVGIKGMVNVVDACITHGIKEMIVASSSEVYQTPPAIPTNESVPLVIPDPANPRYSYAAGKILSEVMALNYGRKQFERILIFRPHNVYGPDMGWEHVIPQFVLRMLDELPKFKDKIRFSIQGTGQETRAFVYIDDFIDGLMCVLEKGAHMGIYNIGTQEEVSMETVARLIGHHFNRDVEIVPGSLSAGSVSRRCPDITKLELLGYKPKISLHNGVRPVVEWYTQNINKKPNLSKG
jgi:nucleoside-diphosphate-sugar epimerase